MARADLEPWLLELSELSEKLSELSNTARCNCKTHCRATAGQDTARDTVGHNFLSFDNQHTKSPKNQYRTYALNLMSKVPKLLDITHSNKRATAAQNRQKRHVEG